MPVCNVELLCVGVSEEEKMNPIVWSVNSCKRSAGIYSCAVDTICDLFYYAIFIKLTDDEIRTLSQFTNVIGLLIAMCVKRKDVVDRNIWSETRADVWNWLLINLPNDFAPKGRSDAAIDNAILSLGESELFKVCTTWLCTKCTVQSYKELNFVTISTRSINTTNGNLPICIEDGIYKSKLCCGTKPNVVVTIMPKFILIVLPVITDRQPHMYDKIEMPDIITIANDTYEICGSIKSTGTHFIPIVKYNRYHYEIDDLKISQKRSTEFKKCAVSNVMCKMANCSDICEKQKIWLLVLVKKAANEREIIGQMLDMERATIETDDEIRKTNKRKQNNNINVYSDDNKRILSKSKSALQKREFRKNCSDAQQQLNCTKSNLRSRQHDVTDTVQQVVKIDTRKETNAKRRKKRSDQNKKQPVKRKCGDTEFCSFLRNVSVDNMSTCLVCTKILFPEHVKLFYQPATFCKRLETAKLPYNLCDICFRCIKKNKHPSLCYENQLDPGCSRILLKLSYMEQKFINLINAFMTVVTLPGGQYALNGQSIHFANDIESLITRLPSDMIESGLIVIDADGTVTVEESKVIRHQLIVRALWWLKCNNSLFKDVTVPGVFWVPSKSNPEFMSSLSTYVPETEISFICEDYSPPSIEDLCKTIKAKKDVQTVQIDRSVGAPLNVFKTLQLEEKSFVKLFPFGINGYSADRKQKITIQSYFKSRLEGSDNRFRSNISYIFWALNVFEQFKLQDQISVALKINTGVHSKQQMVENILNDTSYTFVKNIRGTVGYWKCVLVDLLAKINTLGPPTWFLTLSADDNHWEDMQKLCAFDNDDLKPQDYIRKNPVMASKQFRRRWLAIFNWLKSSKALGDITDHFERVEFQNRGSPHLHIFIWIANSPNLKTPEGRRDFPDFIDKYISSVVPADESMRQLVHKYQMHKHTESCRGRKSKSKCRFYFPRRPCEITKLLPNANYTESRKFYETRRGKEDTLVNPYNAELLKKWKANLDLQFVGNAFGVAAYVCDYICKSEPKKLRESIEKTVSDMKNSSVLSARHILSKYGHSILSSRCIGAYEACFRLLSIPLVNSTRTTLFVNCRPMENRYKVVRREFLHGDVEEQNDSTDICYLSLIDYYMLRPASEIFEQMNLLEFASWYTVVPTIAKCTETKVNYFKLQKCEKAIRKRNKPACIRTNYVSYKKDPEAYYLRLLMLHLPFRSELQLKGEFATLQEAFSSKCSTMKDKIIQQDKFMEELTKAVQQIRIIEAENPSDLIAHIEIGSSTDECKSEANIDELNGFASANRREKATETSQAEMNSNNKWLTSLERNTMTDNQFATKMSELNIEQLDIVNKIKIEITKQIKNDDSQPLHMFVTGKAGCGKSYLISLVYEMLLRLFNNTSGTAVLKCAPTGVASCNIDGSTLHSSLMLPVDFRHRATYYELDPCILQESRKFFKHVQFLIIDEISMVSYRTLTHIHRRLCELKCNNKLFGGVNILAFGDFFQLRPVGDSFVFAPTSDLNHLWNDNFDIYHLRISMRQQAGGIFANLLDKIRVGDSLTEFEMQLLKSRIKSHETDKTFDNALRIFPLKANVRNYNDKMLSELNASSNCTLHQIKSADVRIYSATSSVSENECLSELDNCGLIRNLTLVAGARVMLIRNISVVDKLVNGSIGTIVSFELAERNNEITAVTIQFDHIPAAVEISRITVRYMTRNRTLYERNQFPLTLCYAATIHKVQSLTLQKVVVDCGPTIFESAMSYVAISRVRNLEDLSFVEFCEKSLRANQSVADYYKSIDISKLE